MESSIQAAKSLHKSSNSFGPKSSYSDPKSLKFNLNLPNAIKRINLHKQSINSILDFGTGQGGLVNTLREQLDPSIKVTGYDPAVKQFSAQPTTKFDIVTSIDVLEHIPRHEIDASLIQVDQLTNKFFFFGIDLIPAKKNLPDKRNAHLLTAPADWWAQQLKHHFISLNLIDVGHLQDDSRYPIHLFGCATNHPQHTQEMNQFMSYIEIIWKKWIWQNNGTTLITKFK